MTIEVRLLGPVEAWVGGELVDLRGPRQRRLLAVLALAPGHVVATGQVIDAVWTDGDLPGDPRETLRSYVSRLRASLGGATTVTRLGGGYSLNVDPQAVDVVRFDALVADGSIDALTSALHLWRGSPALAGFEHEDWARPHVSRWQERRASAHDDLGAALHDAGRLAEAVAELAAAAAANPLRERTHQLLMEALHASGRQAEALRVYQAFRRRLATDLGLEPSDAMRTIEARIASGGGREAAAGDGASVDASEGVVRGYTLRARVGEGAFAVVYRGTQPSVGRDVAIKQIRADLANRPDFIRRFEAEAHLVARLEHPHIVPLYDYWREPSSAYLVMRWMRGGSLEDSIARERWPLDRALTLAGQVGSALSVAHEAGVVHRDVKPANILLDEHGHAYLSDFGIALDAERTQQTTDSPSIGSPPYASPEQRRREPVGPPADVYALGVVLFEMLTGRLPRGCDREAPPPQRELTAPMVDVVEQRPALPAALAAVLDRALAASPADRYPTIDDFLADVRGATRSSSGAADPPGSSPNVEPTSVGTIVGRNPFKGLRAFDEADAGDFYGRERLVDALLARLEDDGASSRLLALVGPSGSGKSSVVRAGLLPALRAGRLPASASWFVTTMLPGTAPFDELARALLRVATKPHDDLRDLLASDASGPLRAARRVLGDASAALVLVIDQFEELFTLVTDEVERARFLEALSAAVSAPGSPLRVVLTLRADFYDRPLRYAGFARLLAESTVTIVPFTHDELVTTITAPAARAGAQFDPGLVAEIVADVASQPGALPLLQYALTELFDRRTGSQLPIAAYREMGGLAGALTTRADALYIDAPATVQVGIRRLMSRLVTFGEGSEDTRRRVRRSELVDDAATDVAIEAYGSARLLSFDRDLLTREPTVEVAHEALIRRWPRLREWLDDDRAGLRVHRHLTSAATAWDAGGRDPGELYRGARLQTTDEWAAAHRPDLNRVEREFLDTSVGLRDAEAAAERERLAVQMRQNRRLRRLLVSVAVIAVVAVLAGALAFQQRSRAGRAATAATSTAFEAETRRLVSDAAQLAATNRRVALLLAAEAHRRDPSVETLGGLQRVLVGMGNVLGYAGGGARYEAAEWIDEHRVAAARADAIDVFRDTGEKERTVAVPAVRVLAVSGDGSMLAAGGDDGVTLVDLRDVTTAPRAFRTDDLVQAVAFSPDGRELAVGGRSGDLTVLDVVSLGVATRWRAHPERTFADLRLPDAVSELTPHVPQSSRRGVLAVAFDHQSSLIATAGWGWVRVWERGARAFVSEAPLTRQLDEGSAVASAEETGFATLDGARQLVVVDRTYVRALDPRSGRETRRTALVNADSTAFTAAIRQPATITTDRVVTALGFRTIDVIALDSMTTTASYDTESAEITDLAVSRDGERLVTAGVDGLAIFSLDGGGVIARTFPATGAGDITIANDGATVWRSAARPGDWEIVTIGPDDVPHRESGGGGDGRYLGALLGSDVYAVAVTPPYGVTVVGPRSTQPVFTVPWPHLGGAPSAYRSPDGRLVAFGSLDGFVEIYAWPTAAHVRQFDEPTLLGREVSAHNIAIRSNNRDVSIVGSNGSAAVWDLETGGVRVISPAGGDTATVAYSPDGSMLATVRTDGSIVLRDADTLQPLASAFIGDTSSSAANLGPWFTADGLYLITAGDGNGRLWDIATRRQVGGVFPSDAAWNTTASANGRWLVSGLDGRIVRWDLDVSRWPDLVCRAAGRNLTADEWLQFGPADEPYRATCAQYAGAA